GRAQERTRGSLRRLVGELGGVDLLGGGLLTLRELVGELLFVLALFLFHGDSLGRRRRRCTRRADDLLRDDDGEQVVEEEDVHRDEDRDHDDDEREADDRLTLRPGDLLQLRPALLRERDDAGATRDRWSLCH